MYLIIAAVILIGLSVPCLIVWLFVNELLSPRFKLPAVALASVSYGLALATEALFDVELPGGQGYGTVIIVLSLGWTVVVLTGAIAVKEALNKS